MRKKVTMQQRLITIFLALVMICTMVHIPKKEAKAATTLSNPRMVEDLSMEAGQKVTWDCIWFGSYPQREVVASASQSGCYGKEWSRPDDYIVDSSLYNTLSNATGWDSNGDKILGNAKYRRIKKSDATYGTSDSSVYYNWSDSTSYHYFKYEPIKWRILKVNGSSAFLLADKALDDQMYNKNSTGVTWENSSIRSWLNAYGANVNQPGTDYSTKNFLKCAFSASEQNAIQTTTVVNHDNISYSTKGGNNTSDKVFLLSEEEAYTDAAKAYGFVSSGNTDDEARSCKSSSYAKAMGIYSDITYQGCCWWWLRSPGCITDVAELVDYNGYVGDGGSSVIDSKPGCRPALNLNLQSSNLWSYAGTVGSDGSENETAAPGSGGGTTEPGNGDTPAIEHQNEDGRKVESYSGTFNFPAACYPTEETSINIQYKDDYFRETAYEYNNNLAKASLRLALSAFNTPKGEFGAATTYSQLLKSKAKNVVKLLYDCGFDRDHIKVNDGYLKKPEANSVGVTLGKKYIDDYTLIAVAVRGGGYENEWAGNFTVYNSGGNHHVGFQMAANKVETEILDYISKEHITGKVKFWVTGYSRGAAIANLVSAYLDDLSQKSTSFSLESKGIYSYTFETPRNTKDSKRKNDLYTNIMNIINPIDPVPKVTMKKWGYGRYGNDYYLPSEETTSNYRQWNLNVLNQYNAYTNKFHMYLPKVAGQGALLDGAIDAVASAAKSDHSNMTMIISSELQKKVLDEKNKKDGNLLSTGFSALINDLIGKEIKITQYMMNLILQGHYPELCLSWLDVVNSGQCLLNKCEYRLVKVNCPVNVDVYEEGKLVASIVNDVPQEIEEGYIGAYIDNDGQKVICLPMDGDYKLSMTATDSGKMSYSVMEYDAENGEAKKIANTYDVPLVKGDTYSSVIKSDEENTYVLKDSSGKEIPVDEVMEGAQVRFYNVKVSKQGNGSVSGDNIKIKGEYAIVTAIPDTNYVFAGWYEDGKLVSVEEEYRFRVMKETNLTARFEIKKILSNSVSITSSTNSHKIAIGKKLQLKAKVLPASASNKKVIWKSSNTKYAKVSTTGLVTMSKKSAGKTVTITATAADGSGKKAIYKITGMKGAVKSLKLKGKKTMKVKKTQKLKCTIKVTKGKANKKLMWTSSNTKVATVSATGKVKALKKGKVKITARATDGTNKKASFTITIK